MKKVVVSVSRDLLYKPIVILVKNAENMSWLWETHAFVKRDIPQMPTPVYAPWCQSGLVRVVLMILHVRGNAGTSAQTPLMPVIAALAVARALTNVKQGMPASYPHLRVIASGHLWAKEHRVTRTKIVQWARQNFAKRR